MDFPAYRKYSNNKSYFKVLGPEVFEEIYVIGKRYSIRKYEAKILPDRQLIHDMLHMHNHHWVEITEQEYDKFVLECSQDYKKVE
jgi:hypothetical protein